MFKECRSEVQQRRIRHSWGANLSSHAPVVTSEPERSSKNSPQPPDTHLDSPMCRKRVELFAEVVGRVKMNSFNQRWSNRTDLWFTWAGLPVVADAVDNVVGHSGVLRHRQHIVPRAGDRVPHQEDTVPLPLKEGNRVLAAQSAPVPAASVLGVKITGHGGCEIPVCPRLDALSSTASSFIRNSYKTLFYQLSRLEVNATPRIPTVA